MVDYLSWYLVEANFMCVQNTIVFYEMNGNTILEHLLLFPGIHNQEQSVYLTTAPFPIVNISTSTFEDQILEMGSMKPVGSYPDL